MSKKRQLSVSDDVVWQKIAKLHNSSDARAIDATWDECCESIAKSFDDDGLSNSASHARSLKETC